MKRKNILFIARWYPDRYDPMLGLFVRAHAKAVNVFHNITILYITTDSKLPKHKVEVEISEYENIKEIRIYFGKHNSGVLNFFNYVKYYLRGVEIAENESGKFDLSHVHILSRCAIPALWLKIRSGIPYLITEHWSRYLPVNLKNGSYSGIFRKLFTRWAVASAACVTTVTKNLAEAMQSLGLKNKYYIVPNVADITLFHPSSNIQKNGIKKLVHISCFDEYAKNIKGIINTVQKLSEKRSDFILEIIGTGVDYQNVEEYGKLTGLVDRRIFFTGLLTDEALASKMREAEALVMFSNYENLPCTIVESLCSGIPVISTNVGGIGEHIHEGSGILINPLDETALENAMSKILDDPQSFDRNSISSYGVKYFSMNRIGIQFNEIYCKILEQ